MPKLLPIALATLLLVACGPRREPAPPPALPLPESPLPAGEGILHVVDPARSGIQVLVYRSGTLANLGHNHVITHAGLQGQVRQRPGGSDFSLVLPVAALEVDRPDARAAAGPEFPGVPGPEAVQGTRANLLGERLLDAARFPEIRLRGTALSREPGRAVAQVQLTVRQHRRTLEVPVTFTQRGNTLRVEARLTLNHGDLGLVPFTTLGGLLAVRDDLPVELVLVAESR